jgi:hypothetical protein
MSGSLRWFAVLGLLGLVVLEAPVYGQRVPVGRTPAINVNPNPLIAPGLSLAQYAYNFGVLNNAYKGIPPKLLGFNPFIAGAKTIVNPNGGFGAFGGGYNPYLLTTGSGAGSPSIALSTGGGIGGYNPYLGGTSALSTSPYGGGYSLSTTPGGDSSGYGGYGGYGGYPGYGDIPPSAANLAAMGSLARATGDYWKSIGQARLLREQALQMGLETARKRVEFERWYESMKPTAPQLRARELATDLERARHNPPPLDVWSGKSLNDLLRSVKNAGKGALRRGPNIPLDEETLKMINLTASSGTTGSIAMLKDDGKLTWPEAFQESQFEDVRKKLDKNLRRAVADLKGKDPIDQSTLKDIRGDFKALTAAVNDSANDLSPGQYIEAKRYLNQLSQAIKALSDPKAMNYFNNKWVAKGKNVAELVDHMSSEGLTFAPSAPGEENAYTSLYQSLRAFEAGMQGERDAGTDRPAERPDRPERPERPAKVGGDR